MAEGYHDRFDGVLSDETIDELLDLRLRREFGRAFPAGGDPVGELHGLVPAIGRARTVQRLRTGALGVAAAFVMVAGAGAAMTQLPSLDDQTVSADLPPDRGDDDGLPPVIGEAIAVTGTTAAVDSEVAEPTVDGATASSDTATQPGEADATVPDGAIADDPDTSTVADDTSSTGSPSSIGTPSAPAPDPTPTPAPATSRAPTSATTATTAPPTTMATTTAPSSAPPTTADGDTVIPSTCGSITISSTGVYVFLEETNPGRGYEADIKSNGPYKVEVGFKNEEHGEGEDHDDEQECQLTARVINGSLSISVDD